MRLPVTGLLILALVLAGCGRMRESRLNPFNWFGRSQETTVVATDPIVPGRPGDPRILVAQVTEMEVARHPGGAIVRATGLPPTQGWWDAALVAENNGEPVDGVLTYRFVVDQPLKQTRVSFLFHIILCCGAASWCDKLPCLTAQESCVTWHHMRGSWGDAWLFVWTALTSHIHLCVPPAATADVSAGPQPRCC